ncbi:hypothetical protein BJV77DRAFT_327690 [Russula vinacea]|nr:hypothetical protein BJV77DRAFT_327690 [Russula vinacea]
MQGKRLRQGKVTVINKKRGKVDCVPCNLVPRSIGTTQWVRGTLYLFAVPACYFRSNPQRIFLFLFLEYSSNAPLFPECPQHPQSPVRLYQRSLQRPLAVLHPPFPPNQHRMIHVPSRSRHLPQPPQQYSLPPFPDHTERRTLPPATAFPSAPPPRF